MGVVTNAVTKDRFERAGAAQPIDSAATRRRGGSIGQTDRRTRPLARRAASTLRPPTVLIRARKPCVRARRNLDGWYVRFIVQTLG